MDIVEQLKRDEGVKLQPYKDTVGKITIGIGRNLSDVGISVAEAEYLLMDDLQRTQDKLYEALPWVRDMDPVRRSVLLNMAFNMGVDGLLAFKNTLYLIQNNSLEAAGAEMLRSLWARQVGDRAKRLAKQLVTGEWQ